MKKILFVDDSSIMRLFARISTRNIIGISITEAHDGIEAFKKIENETFDLIITDINMPNMDGLKLIENIRLMGLQIPIVILTTRGEEAEVEKGLMLGANDYLTKPISGNKFHALINNYMDLAV